MNGVLYGHNSSDLEFLDPPLLRESVTQYNPIIIYIISYTSLDFGPVQPVHSPLLYTVLYVERLVYD